MRRAICRLLLMVVAGVWVGTALANSDLAKLESNPDNWAAQSADFALTRHSKLTQINKSNVHKLQVAWSFSTGVLRGHEGGPLARSSSATSSRRTT
jgi:lanthanide-dependent methanol dehydrogenase